MEARQARRSPRRRTPLSRDRVLRAALALADKGGIESLTMRKLARKLRVEAMSLYNHVANKDDLLDGLVELVLSEIEVPSIGADWKPAMRRRAISARDVLSRHPWATRLIESRTKPGPATLRYHDAVLGILRAGGFSIEMAVHAFSILDSYVFGFAVQDISLAFATSTEVAQVGATILEQFPRDEYPYLAETIEHAMRSAYDHAPEFEFGLDLILEGLERARNASQDLL
jgi:AcrR family transcriptional regulator